MNPSQDTGQSGSQRPEPGAKLMIVLLLTMGVGPLLSYGLATTSDYLIRRLDITESQFGLLSTTLFISAALFSILLGRLADVVSVRHQLIFNFCGTALALGIAAFASEYWFLFIAMVIAGPVQVIANPTTNRVISEAVSKVRRPTWIGVKQSGVQAAQLFAGLYFPIMTLWLGWRGAFLGAAGLVILLLLMSLRVLPPAPPTDWSKVRLIFSMRRGSHLESKNMDKLPPAVWVLAGVAFFGGFGVQATNIYLPLYAVRELDFSLVLGGIAAGLTGVVGVVSRVWWGNMMAAGHSAEKLLMWLTTGGTIGIFLLLLASPTQQAWMLWVGVFLFGLTVLGTNVIVNSATMIITPPQRIGTATGITTLGMYAGFAMGPLLSGFLLQLTGSFQASWVAVIIGHILCFGLAVLLKFTPGNPHLKSKQKA